MNIFWCPICRLCQICLNFLFGLVLGTGTSCSGPVGWGGSKEQETASANQQAGRTGYHRHWEVQSHRGGVFVMRFSFSGVLIPVCMRGLMMLSNCRCSAWSGTPCWKNRTICRRKSRHWNSSWKIRRERWMVSSELFRCSVFFNLGPTLMK